MSQTDWTIFEDLIFREFGEPPANDLSPAEALKRALSDISDDPDRLPEWWDIFNVSTEEGAEIPQELALALFRARTYSFCHLNNVWTANDYLRVAKRFMDSTQFNVIATDYKRFFTELVWPPSWSDVLNSIEELIELAEISRLI